MRRSIQIVVLAAAIPLALALAPATAEAQRSHRGAIGGRGRIVVSVQGGGFWGGAWGSPYGPWYPGQWGGFYGRYYDSASDIRLRITPKVAAVYVDGYYAGVVEDFDGPLNHLRVPPGEHEIVVYLKGYHPLRKDLLLKPSQDLDIEGALERLSPGESTEPPPEPVRRPARPGIGEPRRPAEPPEPPEPPDPPDPPRAQRQQPPPVPPPPDEHASDDARTFGALVFRVQPTGAEVLIDGERWQGPEGHERLVVQVSDGTHRVEIRKEGFVTFTKEIRVRRGETAPVNVSLPPREK